MFPGGMGNMQAMMKKVQKMQADMAKMQEDLKSRTVETSVGGGAVTVVVSGKKELKSIKINPTAADPGNSAGNASTAENSGNAPTIAPNPGV